MVVFLLGLLASIALHEVGHMGPAKKFGVKVTQYFVGFGRRSGRPARRHRVRHQGDPDGWLHRLVGMLPPAKDAPVGDRRRRPPQRVRTSNGFFSQLIADARAVGVRAGPPGDEDRLFYRKPWWQKVIIMAGGPMMNVLLACFLLGVLIMGIGVRDAQHHRRQVSDCVIPAADEGRECTARRPGGPAAKAGCGRATRSCRSTASRSTTGTSSPS